MTSPAVLSSDSTVVTPRDHGALIIIAAVVGVTWTVLVYLIRLYIRLRLNGPMGLDDAAATAATVVGVVQAIVTLVSVHDGLGKDQDLLSREGIEAAMRKNFIASLLYIVAICFSKSSMFLLIARLSQQMRHLVASYGMTLFTVIWAAVSLPIIALQCNSMQAWSPGDRGRCPSLFSRWTGVEILSMFIECSISAMAVVLVWHLAMPFKTKVMVVSAFSAQLLVILPIVYRLLYVRRAVDRSDVTMSITESVMATQVVMHFSIMAATFPCFRQFLQAFDSGLGATTKIGTETTAVAPSAGAGQSHALDSLKSRASSGAGRERLRPDQVGMSTKVAASVSNSNSAGEENMSIESMGSDKAIWRTRRWEIHYESRARV